MTGTYSYGIYRERDALCCEQTVLLKEDAIITLYDCYFLFDKINNKTFLIHRHFSYKWKYF